MRLTESSLQADGGAAPVLAPPVGRLLSQGAAEAGAVCPVCGKAFKGDKYKFRLSRHMIIHTGQKPFACPHCPYRANIRTNLTRHVAIQHAHAPVLPIMAPSPQTSSTYNFSTSAAHSRNLTTINNPYFTSETRSTLKSTEQNDSGAEAFE